MRAKILTIDKIIVASILATTIFSCISSKVAPLNEAQINCLKLDPQSHNSAQFNPEWMAKNKIYKIVEREYLDGRSGKVHLVNIMYFNENGYLQTEFNGLSYPKSTEPNEQSLTSRMDYTYEKLDSFLIGQERIIRWFNEKGALSQPDTLAIGYRSINFSKAQKLFEKDGKLSREYEYDGNRDLIGVKDADGNYLFKVNYQVKNKIEVQRLFIKDITMKSIVILNSKGQIISNQDDLNGITTEFVYNESGGVVEEKMILKNMEVSYKTYQYFTR